MKLVRTLVVSSSSAIVRALGPRRGHAWNPDIETRLRQTDQIAHRLASRQPMNQTQPRAEITLWIVTLICYLSQRPSAIRKI
jgi:hypothetical protein